MSSRIGDLVAVALLVVLVLVSWYSPADRARAARAAGRNSAPAGAHHLQPDAAAGSAMSGPVPTCPCGCGGQVRTPRRGPQGHYASPACRARVARRRLAGVPDDTPPTEPKGRSRELLIAAERRTRNDAQHGIGGPAGEPASAAS